MSAVTKIIAGIALIAVAIVAAPFTGGLSLNLIPVGLTLIVQGVMGLFIKPSTNSDASKITVKIAEPMRWLHAGRVRAGGAVLYAEFDEIGNLWVIVVHSDSILADTVKYYLDDQAVTLDADGNVTTNDFCLDGDLEPYEDGASTKHTFFRINTTTYSATDPTPPSLAAFKAANPQWTDDHKLVGCTYSVLLGKGLKLEHRHKIYRWRGPLGLGEPALSIVGDWERVYNPLDGAQVNGNPSTYQFSRNAVLIWAWFRTHPHGRNKSRDSINWDKVAEQAAIANHDIAGITGTQKRYLCDTATPDDRERAAAEQEILKTMDAQLVFDDDGRCWPRVGFYQAPTLSLTRNRDIVAMESVEPGEGDIEYQGVIVRYTEPDANYTPQPCAAWYNPAYYVEGQPAQFATVDILACSNHNQAMRLAKTIALRSQPPHKIAPTVGLRGLKARQERIINLNYDNTFSGEYEIITPVEVDPAGIFCGFGLVPIDENRFTLLPGEERAKPVTSDDGNVKPVVAPPVGVTVTYANGRLEAEFDAPVREDVTYEFEYIKTDDIATNKWLRMTVQMDELVAYSGTVNQNISYSVRWRSRLPSNRSSVWNDPPLEVISSALTLSGNPALTGAVGVAYAGFTIGVTGGKTPYLFSDIYDRLPPGIVVNAATGAVSGTPTMAGNYNDILIRVHDADVHFNDFPLFNIVIS